MSAEFFFRLLGMVGLAVGGLYLGTYLSGLAGSGPKELWAMIFSLVGALLGLVLTPFFTTRPARAGRRLLGQLPAATLASALIGLVAGLIVGALASLPLSLLPSPFGTFLPFVSAVLFAYFGVALFVMRQNDVFSFLNARFVPGSNTGGAETRSILLDTSVIIDGRVVDVAATGFLQSTLLVPRFVLTELQTSRIRPTPCGANEAAGAWKFSTACRRTAGRLCGSRIWMSRMCVGPMKSW
jgi:uncharacterized protein YacL